MANKISEEMMDKLSVLAKLELSLQEREKTKEDMEKMLEYLDLLQTLDTTDVLPISQLFPVQNIFREDFVENTDAGVQMLANAPRQADGQFLVPKTVKS